MPTLVKAKAAPPSLMTPLNVVEVLAAPVVKVAAAAPLFVTVPAPSTRERGAGKQRPAGMRAKTDASAREAQNLTVTATAVQHQVHRINPHAPARTLTRQDAITQAGKASRFGFR